MKYATTFALLAVFALVGALAADDWPLRIVLAASATAFALVALAYAGVGPRLLGKRPDGRRAWWAWAVLWPYAGLNAVAFRLAVRSGRGPAFAEVVPNLYFGRRLTAREARSAGVNWVAVLDLAAEFPGVAPLRSLRDYRSLPVLDATPPTADQLRDAVRWLQDRVPRGPVLVHCAMGHGRTGTVVAAYLIATGRAADARAGVAALRALRPGVGLNRHQRAALS